MKKTLLIITSVLILGFTQVSAQTSLTVPVEVSKDLVRIDQAIYYVHLVKNGQTIYAISKAYDIPISDIEASNPSVKTGLKPGSFIYIPASKPSSSGTSSEKKTQSQPEKKAEPAETQKTQQENTSSKKEKKAKKSKSEQDKYKYRYVRGETARESVVETTAEAVTASAAAGTIMAAEKEMITSGTVENTEAEPVRTAGEIQAVKSIPATVSADTYKKWNSTNTVSIIIPFGKSARYGAAELNQSDFYSGILLALHDLRKDSRYSKYHLNVIDMDSWNSAEEMLSESQISESSLIVGPITPNDVTPVAEYAKENRIPIVSPLDIRTAELADENPYLFIFPSANEYVQRRLLERFFYDITDETLIIISEKGKNLSATASNAVAMADSLGLTVRDYSYAILQNQNVTADLKAMIPEENATQARVLVASEDEAFVADALRNLNVMVTTEKRNLAVFGMPKWRNFGSVQLEYLHNLNTHISLNYHLNYNDYETLSMTERFEEIFHTSPTPFAYQGYDIARFFIQMLEEYGSVFPVEIMNNRYSAIQSDIEFHQKHPGGGFANTAVRDIVYRPDWLIESK